MSEHKIIKEVLNKEEKKFISLYDTYKLGYNSNIGGSYYDCRKGITSSFKGKHHSEESKRKNSESHKGKIPWNKGKEFLKDENNPMVLEKWYKSIERWLLSSR